MGSRAGLVAFGIAGVSALAGLLIGFNTAVIAGALPFLAMEMALGPLGKGVVVSAVLVGGLVGAVASGPISARIGQRRTLALAGLTFVLGAWAGAVAPEAVTLGASRAVLGLAVGAATMLAPLYVAETAPPSWRGALVASVQLAITAGILGAYLAGWAHTPSGDWRAMLFVGIWPATLLLIGLIFLPESPRWLLLRGREDEARVVWRKLGGVEWSPADLAVLRASAAESGGWRDLVGPRVRPVLVVAAGLFLLQNLSGIDAILYYAPDIFLRIGISGATGPILATVGLGVVNLLATVVSMWAVEALGRRRLLLGGSAAMAAALALLAAALVLAPGSGAANWVSLACISVFIVAFALSLGPIPYVLMSELFPMRVRSLGMGVAAATAWGVNAAVSLAFPVIEASIGMGETFGVFALVCAATYVFAVKMVPETRDRTLEHIEANLRAGRRARDLGAALPGG